MESRRNDRNRATNISAVPTALGRVMCDLPGTEVPGYSRALPTAPKLLAKHLAVQVSLANKEPRLITTRVSASLVLVVVSIFLALDIRGLNRLVPQPYDWKLLSLSFLPDWGQAAFSVFFYLWFACIVSEMFLAAERKDERVLIACGFGVVLLHPVAAIWPAVFELQRSQIWR